MKNFGDSFRKVLLVCPWKTICLIALVVLFFSFTVVITYDGGHYLNYVAIFEKELPASSWDIVRGPVFPVIIFLFDKLFGKTSVGILVGLFLFYILFATLVYLCVKELTKGTRRQKLIQNVMLMFLILNPLIFGFYHVLLTEFVAISVMVLNIYVAYRWLFVEKNKKNCIFFFIFWAIAVSFCYHLKQPYLTISFLLLLISSVLSIVRDCRKNNILMNIGILGGTIVFLFGTILAWNAVIDRIGADKETGRDSSSMFGMQLLDAGQIKNDSDGDGKNDQISTFGAISLLVKKFGSNPFGTIKIYLQNYCGLISMCKVVSENGVNFVSTPELTPLTLFENSIIGYQPYRDSDSVSPMPEGQYERALKYQTNIDRGVFATIMYYLEVPTTIIFKLSMVLYPLALIVIVILRKKDERRKNDQLYYFSLMLLLSVLGHLIISSAAGLIIDRYAIEVFIPAILGIFGTIRYIIVLKPLFGKTKRGKK